MHFILQDMLIEAQDAFIIIPALVAERAPYAYHLELNEDGTFGPHYSIRQTETGHLIATGLFTRQSCEQLITLAAGAKVGVLVG